jgi:hypothetical protein
VRAGRLRHVARMLLIAFYSHTRPWTILKLKLLPSADGAHVDLDAGIVSGVGPNAATYTRTISSKKRVTG